MRFKSMKPNDTVRKTFVALATLALTCWATTGAYAGVDKNPEPPCKGFFWDTQPGDPGMTGATAATTNVFALAVVGNDLFAGGQFTGAGGNPMTNIARWNGGEWESVGNANGIVRAMTQYDGELYAAGEFTMIGGISANRIARFDGSNWNALPTGPTAQGNPTIRALAVHDGELYIGGQFSGFIGVSNSMRIVRWNGTSFSNVGGYNITGQINALASFDGDLYMAGAITNIRPPSTTTNIAVNNIARWDGAAWHAMGSPAGVNGPVNALAAFGDHLYVGGSFTTAGGMPAAKIARWDGAWSAPGAIASGNVHAMTSHDDGETINLYIGGSFNSVSGVPAQNIAQFDGANWTALNGGLGVNTSIVYALASHSECALRGVFRPSLYAGGNFQIADGGLTAQRVARWVACEDDGKDPNAPCDDGWDIASGDPGPDHVVWALKSFGFSDGCVDESYLYAGGQFLSLEDPIDPISDRGLSSPGLMRWNGESWSDVDGGVYRRTGPNEYPPGIVYAMHGFNPNDGSGTQLYIGGFFSTPGVFLPEPPDTEASFIANNLVRYDGFAWTDIRGVSLGAGNNTSGSIRAMASDDGPRLNAVPTLYVGGEFDTANVPNGIPPHLNTIEALNVAQWDAVNGWSALGGGLSGVVYAMIFENFGEGDSLYVGGDFSIAFNEVVLADGSRGVTPVEVNGIARWDGSMWHPVGPGFDDEVRALVMFNDELYAGGNFCSTADVQDCDPTNFLAGVARWDGEDWRRVGGGLFGDDPGGVLTLHTYDDGHGVRLYAGGVFYATDPTDFTFIGHMAVLNNGVWTPPEHGAVFSKSFGGVVAMEQHFDGMGGLADPLYVGGLFDAVAVEITFRSDERGFDNFLLTRNMAAIRTCGARPCDAEVDAEFADPGATSPTGGAVYAVKPLSPIEFDPLPAFIDNVFTLIGGDFTNVTGLDRIGTAGRSLTGGWFRMVDLHQTFAANDDERSLTPGFGYSIAESPSDEPLAKFAYVGGEFNHVLHDSIEDDGSIFTDNIVGVVVSEIIFPFTLGRGVSGPVYAVEAASADDFGPSVSGERGPDIYSLANSVVFAAGDFSYALNNFAEDRGNGPAGGVLVNNVARWDSNSNTWSALGSGLNDEALALVLDLYYPDPLLYAGGRFSGPGDNERGVALNNVAVYEFGSGEWQPLGNGLNGTVTGLARLTSNDAQPQIFAIGSFTDEAGAEGGSLNGFAYFDNGAWVGVDKPDGYLGPNEESDVYAIHVYNDGAGPAIFLSYDTSDGRGTSSTHRRISRYRNGIWTHVTEPFEGFVYTMHGYFNEIDGYHYLVVGGDFDEINGVSVQNVTRIRLCPAAPDGPEPLCAAPRIIDLLGTTGELAYGAPVVMAVSASGNNVSYQWSRNGMPLVDDDRISGANTNMLTITGALAGPGGDTGVYTVAAVNSCGAVGSSGLQLMVMCYGDADLDGLVSFSDMSVVLGNYGQAGAGLTGDLNHDGVVDFTDLSLVLSNYGRDCRVPTNGR